MKARNASRGSAAQLAPIHLLLAAALLALVVMPLAFAGATPEASKSAKLVKQVKKLKQRVAALEGKPGSVPSSLPPSGPAGGALTGAYPSPLIAAGAVGPGELRNPAPVVINEVLQTGGASACDIGVHNTFCGVPGDGWRQPTATGGRALYFVDGEGFVHLQGAAQAVGANTGNGHLFTLPIALAPAGLQDDQLLLFPMFEVEGGTGELTNGFVAVETSDALPDRVIVSASDEGQDGDLAFLPPISWGTN